MIPALEKMTKADWERARKILKPTEFEELVAIFEREMWLDQHRKLYSYYPDAGPLRRELYPKHVAFFAAGKEHQERGFLGGNRTGKSTCVSYEATCHLTGWYPKWWPGYRFDRPTIWWFAGTDGKAVRESLQPTLFGPPQDIGSGMIPHEFIIGKPTAKSGVPEAYDAFNIRHASGGISRGLFKAYDQGRDSFQGAKIDGIVFDEEPPMPVYSEGILRTMATDGRSRNGLVMCAFTPLLGLSKVYGLYMPGGRLPEHHAA